MSEPVRQTETRQIGRQIRLIREKSGRSVGQLAGAAGLSERAVRKLEAGRTNPSLATVVSIVDALGVTLDEVVAAARRNRPVASYTPASACTGNGAELSAQLRDARMRARLVRASGESDALPTGPVFGHVLDGRFQIALHGEQTALGKGDSFHAQAGVLQSWRTQSPGGLLLVVEAAKFGDDHAGPRSEPVGA